jgi:DNA-binding LacI/PurR family transcriptional regulator
VIVNKENLRFIGEIAERMEREPAEGALTEWLYEAFRREITAKRWKTGDFLPAPSDVARGTGVSTASVSRSYGKLAKQGYIRRIKHKGSEVLTHSPPLTTPLVIGIVLCDPRNKSLFRSEAYAQKLAFACLECAKRRGFESEISVLSAEQLTQPYLLAASLFGKFPNGIVAVGPAPRLNNLNGNAIPMIYLHRSANHLRPCVMGDARMAINQMTARAIESGHRKIVFMGDREWRWDSEIRWQFHSEAMNKAGLEPNESGYRHSLRLSPGDLSDWKHLIHERKEATCFISGVRAQTAEMLAAASVALGKRMPADFSLLSYGQATFISEAGETRVESMDHDVGSLLVAGMDMLCSQIRGDYEDVVSLVVSPRWYDGTTFGSIPNKPAVSP